jgi:hypothetical protein
MKEIINVKSVEVNNSTITIIDDSDQIYRYSSLEIKHVQLLSDKKSSDLKHTKYQEVLLNVVGFVFLIIIYRFLFRISPKNDIGIILKIVYYSILPLLICIIPVYLASLSLGMFKKNRDIFSISTDLKTYQKFRDSNSIILFSGFFDKNIDWDKDAKKSFINYTNNEWGWGIFYFLILVSYLIYEAFANNYLQDHPYWHTNNNNSNWLYEFYLSFIIVIKTIAYIINMILFGIWKIIAHCLPEICIFFILVRLVDLMTKFSPVMTKFSPVMTKITCFIYEVKTIFIGITLILLVFAVTRFIGEDLQFIFKLIPPNFYVVFLSIITMIALFRINLMLLILNSIDNWPKTYDSSELQSLYYKKNTLIPNIESVNYMPTTLKYLFIKNNKQIINSRKIEFENKFCECEYEDRMNKKLDINGTVFLFKDLDVVSFQSGQKLELMELSSFDELYEKKNLLKWLQFAASKTPAVIKTGGFNGKGDQFYYNRSALENSQLIAPSGYELANDIDYRMIQEYYYGNTSIIHNTEFFSFYQIYYSDTWEYGCGIKLDGSRILYKNQKIEYFKAKCKKIIESNDSK